MSTSGENGGPVDDAKNMRAAQVHFFQTFTEAPFIAGFQGNDVEGDDPITITGSAYTIRPDSVLGEQRTKLDYLFNIYQQYRLWGFKVQFRPRVTESIPVYSNPTISTTALNDSYIYNSDTQIVLIPEHDDAVLRTNNIDELWQAKILPHAKSFMATERGELFVRATTLQGDEQNNGGTIPVDSTGWFTSPTPSRWLSTKFESGLGNYSYNEDIPNFGFKLYAYNPYFAYTAPSATPIVDNRILGTISIQCYWQFRNLDNRALLTPTVLMSMVDSNLMGTPAVYSLDSYLKSSSNTLKTITSEDNTRKRARMEEEHL